mgnify:CR=1 FL=1
MLTLANLKYRVLILGVVRQRNKVQQINVTLYHDSHLNQKTLATNYIIICSYIVLLLFL